MHAVAAAAVDVANCVAFDTIRDADVSHSEEPSVGKEGGLMTVGNVVCVARELLVERDRWKLQGRMNG